MQEAFGPYLGDEFVWLLEGGFKMVDGDNEVLDRHQQGDCVYFRNAAPVSWVQEEHLNQGGDAPLLQAALGLFE